MSHDQHKDTYRNNKQNKRDLQHMFSSFLPSDFINTLAHKHYSQMICRLQFCNKKKSTHSDALSSCLTPNSQSRAFALSVRLRRTFARSRRRKNKCRFASLMLRRNDSSRHSLSLSFGFAIPANRKTHALKQAWDMCLPIDCCAAAYYVTSSPCHRHRLRASGVRVL